MDVFNGLKTYRRCCLRQPSDSPKYPTRETGLYHPHKNQYGSTSTRKPTHTHTQEAVHNKRKNNNTFTTTQLYTITPTINV